MNRFHSGVLFSLGKKSILFLFFLIGLLPLSYNSLSVNYSFILLPITIIILEGKIKIPSLLILFSTTFYFLLLVVTFFFYSDYSQLEVRRFISFSIFISTFLFCFVKVDLDILDSFKKSLIFISVYLSLNSLLIFYLEGGSAMGFKAKYILGTNRTGFLHIMTLMYLVVEWHKINYSQLIKLILIGIVIVGLMLTFSRTSVISSSLIIISYYFIKTVNWISKPNFSGLYKSFGYITFICLLLYFIVPSFDLVFRFFNERLITLFLSNEFLLNSTQKQFSSEGIRFQIWESVLNYISDHPFRGGGFLGVWVLPGTPEASAHNQYIDVLYRTGVIGFFFYSIILFKITRCLYKFEKGLYWGFIGILLYGFFNETFKNSQGALILAVLMGFSENGHYKHKRKYKNLV